MPKEIGITVVSNQYHYHFEDLIDYFLRTYFIFQQNQQMNNQEITHDYEKLALISLRQLITKNKKNHINFITWINRTTEIVGRLSKSDLLLEQRIDDKSFRFFRNTFLNSLKEYNLLFSNKKAIVNDYGISEIDKLVKFADKIVAHFSYFEIEIWDHTHEIFYDKVLLKKIAASLYNIRASIRMYNTLEGCGELQMDEYISFDDMLTIENESAKQS